MNEMIEIAKRMLASGYYLNPASFPVVPLGHSGLRFTHTLFHHVDQIEEMLRTLGDHIFDVVGEVVIDVTDDAAEDLGELLDVRRSS